MAKELFPGCVAMGMDEFLDMVTGEAKQPSLEEELREALRWAHQEIMQAHKCFKDVAEAKDYFDHMNRIHELLTKEEVGPLEAQMVNALAQGDWIPESTDEWGKR